MDTKTCTKCGTKLPATSEHFGHTPNGNLRGSCRDCMNRTSQKWRARNPDDQAEYNANRASREAEAGAGCSGIELARIRKQLSDRCAYCDIPLRGAGVEDHIIPIRQGGSNSADNITLACWKCNGDKHSKTPEEFIAWRRRGGLPVRPGLNWARYRLPVTDDGVVELLCLLLEKSEAVRAEYKQAVSERLSTIKTLLLAELQRLPAEERAAISMRYGINCSRVTTLWLIGDRLGLSQPKVSGLLKDATVKLQRSGLVVEVEKVMPSKLPRPPSVTLAMQRYDQNMAKMKAQYPGKTLQEILTLRKQQAKRE